MVLWFWWFALGFACCFRFLVVFLFCADWLAILICVGWVFDYGLLLGSYVAACLLDLQFFGLLVLVCGNSVVVFIYCLILFDCLWVSSCLVSLFGAVLFCVVSIDFVVICCVCVYCVPFICVCILGVCWFVSF